MTRHEIREQVFRALFQYEFYEDEEAIRHQQLYLFLDEDIDFKGSESERGEIKETIDGILSVIGEIDARIDEAATSWSVQRLNKVDLAILRLATYELLYPRLDVGIVVNEAVELAKSYGTDDSGRFVNGVLGRIAKEAGQ
ncbi:MAG: transcription antitermination factor NusB [Lachnospiraceae bacterium]|nr:transcription antitermination factor NusB [Lachnospiraceae bacterium]